MPRKIRQTTSRELIEVARNLRKGSTQAEHRLWQALRGNQLDGLKFRRQHAVGPYVLDFFCVAHALAVEVDGSIHNHEDQKCHDQDRTEYLTGLGICVLRFTNDQVEQDLLSVLASIKEWVKQGKRPHPPAPSPGR